MGMDEARLFHRMLDVIEDDILPLTRRTVPEGHKIFGAAVLRAEDLSLVRAGTNHEAWCPLWHGEIYTIKEFFEDKTHPRPEECLFLSTHEPCSMCLSALAWSGFPRVYFFFGYEQTEGDFHIPHDLRMLDEIFHCRKPARKSSFLEMTPLFDLMPGLPDPDAARARCERIRRAYVDVSAVYQAIKDHSVEIARK